MLNINKYALAKACLLVFSIFCLEFLNNHNVKKQTNKQTCPRSHRSHQNQNSCRHSDPKAMHFCHAP